MMESTGPSRRRRWRGIRESITCQAIDQWAFLEIFHIITCLGLDHFECRALFHLVECRLAVATGPGKRVVFRF